MTPMIPLNTAKVSSKCLPTFDHCYSRKIHSSKRNLAPRNVSPPETEDVRIRWQRENELINSQFTADGYYIGGPGGLEKLLEEKAKIKRQATTETLLMLGIFLTAVLGIISSNSKEPKKSKDNEMAPSVSKE